MLEILLDATVRAGTPILFATLIIILVFLPIFFLPGLEGRLLRPLGFAFIAALAGARKPRARASTPAARLSE